MQVTAQYMRAGALRKMLSALAVLAMTSTSPVVAADTSENTPVPTVDASAATAAAPASAAGAPAADQQASAAPAAQGGPDTPVTIVSAGFTLDRIIAKFNEAGVKVVAKGKTAAVKIPSFIQRKTPAKEALTNLVNQQPSWLLYEPADQPGTFEIWDQESYKAEVLPRLVRPKTFLLKNITAEEASKAVSGVITQGIGTVAADPRSNKIFVTDLVPVLELVQRLLEQIDVEFFTRVYYIKHADVQAISEKLANLKSPAAPAPEVDERTRLIIVRDRFDVLRQMELVVETLDVGPDMRVYNLNNVGVEGEDLEQLEDAINEVITEGAFFKINDKQGRMIVRDVPEVHEQIEKILSAFDTPMRQILLQAEIIETEVAAGFEYGIDYAFSPDLGQSSINRLLNIGIPSPGTGAAAAAIGFEDFRNGFPFLAGGSGGISAGMLTQHAFVRFQAAMNDSRTRILQQPRIQVENQETASFIVGQQIPYFTGGSIGVTGTGNNNTLTPSQPVQQFLNVGLSVEVTPVIANNGMIKMEIVVTNDTADRSQPAVTFNAAEFTAIGKNQQELETVLSIPSGETRMIGGLMSDQKRQEVSGIPGLSRIPVVGPLLFGSYSAPDDQNRRRNLLIFLTPSIIQEEPDDLLKYKGRLLADSTVEVPTTPTATLSDYDLERELPLPPDKTAYLDAPLDYSAPSLAPPVDMPPPSGADELPPLSDVPESAQPLDAVDEPGMGMQTLKKIRISEPAVNTEDSRIRSMLPKVPAPRGTLTGTAPAAAQQPGAPVPGQPGQPGQPPPVARTPAVTQPVVVQQPSPVQVTPVIAATPGVIQPPPAETRH